MITEDFQFFLNEDLLLNSGLDLKQTYGLTLPISYETARVWMQSLGFSFSDFKKGIYNDGHDHEDNVQHRINLIDCYLEWQDVSKEFLVIPVAQTILCTLTEQMPNDCLVFQMLILSSMLFLTA